MNTRDQDLIALPVTPLELKKNFTDTITKGFSLSENNLEFSFEEYNKEIPVQFRAHPPRIHTKILQIDGREVVCAEKYVGSSVAEDYEYIIGTGLEMKIMRNGGMCLYIHIEAWNGVDELFTNELLFGIHMHLKNLDKYYCDNYACLLAKNKKETRSPMKTLNELSDNDVFTSGFIIEFKLSTKQNIIKQEEEADNWWYKYIEYYKSFKEDIENHPAYVDVSGFPEMRDIKGIVVGTSDGSIENGHFIHVLKDGSLDIIGKALRTYIEKQPLINRPIALNNSGTIRGSEILASCPVLSLIMIFSKFRQSLFLDLVKTYGVDYLFNAISLDQTYNALQFLITRNNDINTRQEWKTILELFGKKHPLFLDLPIGITLKTSWYNGNTDNTDIQSQGECEWYKKPAVNLTGKFYEKACSFHKLYKSKSSETNLEVLRKIDWTNFPYDRLKELEYPIDHIKEELGLIKIVFKNPIMPNGFCRWGKIYIAERPDLLNSAMRINSISLQLRGDSRSFPITKAFLDREFKFRSKHPNVGTNGEVCLGALLQNNDSTLSTFVKMMMIPNLDSAYHRGFEVIFSDIECIQSFKRTWDSAERILPTIPFMRVIDNTVPKEGV
jgi:hypothetical protein